MCGCGWLTAWRCDGGWAARGRYLRLSWEEEEERSLWGREATLPELRRQDCRVRWYDGSRELNRASVSDGKWFLRPQ